MKHKVKAVKRKMCDCQGYDSMVCIFECTICHRWEFVLEETGEIVEIQIKK